jgi:hypothetical protein
MHKPARPKRWSAKETGGYSGIPFIDFSRCLPGARLKARHTHEFCNRKKSLAGCEGSATASMSYANLLQTSTLRAASRRRPQRL